MITLPVLYMFHSNLETIEVGCVSFHLAKVHDKTDVLAIPIPEFPSVVSFSLLARLRHQLHAWPGGRPASRQTSR